MSAAAIKPRRDPAQGRAGAPRGMDRPLVGSGPGTHGGYLAALGLGAMRARLVGS